MILYFCMVYLPLISLSFSIHLSFILSSPLREQRFLLSLLLLLGDQLYLLSFSFLLCALFLPLACTPLCLLLEILCVHSSLFFVSYSLILIRLTKLSLSCVFRLSFLHSLSFLAALFFLSNVLVFVTISLCFGFGFL